MFLPGCTCCGSCAIKPYMLFEWVDEPPESLANAISSFCPWYWQPGIVLRKGQSCAASGLIPPQGMVHLWTDYSAVTANNYSMSITETELRLTGLRVLCGMHSRDDNGVLQGVTIADPVAGAPFFGTGYRYRIRQITQSEAASYEAVVGAKRDRDTQGNAILQPGRMPTLTVYGVTFTAQSFSVLPVTTFSLPAYEWNFGNQTATAADGRIVQIGAGINTKVLRSGYNEVIGVSVYVVGSFALRSRGAYRESFWVPTVKQACGGCQLGYEAAGAVMWTHASENDRPSGGSVEPWNADISGLVPHAASIVNPYYCASAATGITWTTRLGNKTTYNANGPAKYDATPPTEDDDAVFSNGPQNEAP